MAPLYFECAGCCHGILALVWEDETGQVWVAYNDPAWLAARHDLKDRAELVKAMTTALDALTDAATKGTR